MFLVICCAIVWVRNHADIYRKGNNMDKEITARIKGLLTSKGKRYSELAAYMGLRPQSLYNKMDRGSYSADDLIKIASFLGVELAFINVGTPAVVVLDEGCIRDKEESV